MAQFLITYDLHNRRNYLRLYQLMASWKAVRLTESIWLANLNGDAGIVRNIVASTVDHDDTVAVIEIKQDADWATLRVKPAASAWLAAYVRPAQKAA